MRKGLTLIELLVVVTLLSVLAGVVSQVFLLGLKVWSTDWNRTEIRQKAALGLERMTRELGQAGSITTARANRIRFSADVDNDGSDETVTFRFYPARDEIRRTVDGTAMVMTPYIQAFALSYYRANTGTDFTPSSQADRDDIRVIGISLTLNKGDETITLSSSIYPRNQGL